MNTPASLVTRLRDELAERREHSNRRRELRRQLASYTSPAEVDDLLARLAHEDTPMVEDMRTLLLRNRNVNSNLPFAS